jgi:hypothetical protein
MGTLHPVGGLPPLAHLHPVRDAAHVDLRDGRALAGVEVFRLQDDVKRVVDLHDVALAQLRCDDLHDASDLLGKGVSASSAKGPDMTWWHRQTHADRRPILLARNRIQAALRAWFTDQGFVEVDPAYLVTSPGNETHLHPVLVEVMDDALTTRRGYLHTSPEFAMKKLLAAGEEKIFTFSRVWRNREGGPRHRVEFTMLEWYRADAPYEDLMDDCAAILSLTADAADVTRFRHGRPPATPAPAPPAPPSPPSSCATASTF